MNKNDTSKTKPSKQFKPWFDKLIVKVGIILFIIFAAVWPFFYNHVIADPTNPKDGLSPDGILTFAGSLIAFAGTIFLAGVAWYQNKTASDVNKELIDLNKKMQDIQMAENRALFEVECDTETPVFQLDNELSSAAFLFYLKTAKGRDFNCMMLIKKVYTTNNDLFSEFMDHRIGYTNEDGQSIDIWEIILLQKNYPNRKIAVDVKIPNELLTDKKILVLEIHLEHNDIYGRTNVDELKIFYIIKSEKTEKPDKPNKSLKFYCYSISPRDNN